MTHKVFCDYGLCGMMRVVYHDFVWGAVNAAYPGQIKEWEMKTAPRNFWNEETGIHGHQMVD